MRKRTILVGAGIFFTLLLLSPILFRKFTVLLTSDGKVTAVAKRPFVFPWNDNEFSVYQGSSKIFSLWGDVWDDPLFIHPFADEKRFLCIYDDDTSVLVFVLDLNTSLISSGKRPTWPSDDFLRSYMATRMSKVVMETHGVVRLPTYSELKEAAQELKSLTQSQLEAISFPQADFGVYRIYWSKKVLLSELEPGRRSAWP
jgi:hypothetical protein